LSRTSARDMHYREALYSLTEEAVLDDQSIQRYIVKPPPGGEAARSGARIHSQIDYAPFEPPADRQAGQQLESVEDFSLLMNPSSPVVIQARKGELTAECHLGRCEAALIDSGAKAELWIPEDNDRVMQFWQRGKGSDGWQDLLCISMGATKTEFALRLDGCYPEAHWLVAEAAAGQDTFNHVVDQLGNGLERLSKDAMSVVWEGDEDGKSENRNKVRRKLRICVSYPGYVKYGTEQQYRRTNIFPAAATRRIWG